MAYLRCDVKNCSYNHECYCSLNQIQMGQTIATNKEQTCCESFAEGEYIASNCVTEPEEVVSIKCSAKECVFNDGHQCYAEAVDVGGAVTSCCIDDTRCNTFICRDLKEE